MSTALHDIDERTNLTANNKFELLLFRLGEAPGAHHRELFGINVFKIREIMVMPSITEIANAPPNVMGIANIRGQVITVINLPGIVGCTPRKGTSILLVTEYARSTQAFAVEEVNEIARLDWNQVIAAEGKGGSLITSIARLDGDKEGSRLAQVLDVEQILRDVLPSATGNMMPGIIASKIKLPAGKVVLAADDSPLARSMIENALNALNVPYVMTKTGLEAWSKIQSMSDIAATEGKTIQDKVALVLTDLEMPEMDGFTLTRNVKNDQRFKSIPVIIHSSLTGEANENHVKSVGADAYVAKFAAEELADAMRKVLA
ncbi:chemotaxis protein [Nitrosomonas supralitoralis]|uniref:Chemotaxis protein CheV n=1 Tax=Nitrosomonas supralitoralis TaxID=2116706 RepID=A0A2P7NY17_9PROT|nr:chemotaxis protein [Nitrosomonas supralitoralis]PSJ18352.1 chemotaxis protein CheV [Nitrosomonas supralitoralis]